jgi:hypothetical protein
MVHGWEVEEESVCPIWCGQLNYRYT